MKQKKDQVILRGKATVEVVEELTKEARKYVMDKLLDIEETTEFNEVIGPYQGNLADFRFEPGSFASEEDGNTLSSKFFAQKEALVGQGQW